jgi:hypothetical protein
MNDCVMEIVALTRSIWPDNHDGFQLYCEWSTDANEPLRFAFYAMDCVLDCEDIEADSLTAICDKLRDKLKQMKEAEDAHTS